MKRKLLLIPFLAVLTCFMAIMPRIVTAGSQDPVSMLNSIANQMIYELKSHRANLKTSPGLVYNITNRIVVPHADLDAMAQHVMPAQSWKQATPSQRIAFKREFTRVLERTYASALANYSDETVRFYPVRGGRGGRVSVNSEIVRSDGPSIHVTYTLVQSNGWKLYDMTVEGVSMLESFRSQFGDQLSRSNVGDLINTLRRHNGR